MPLEFFIMLSSIAGLKGTVSQSNYAAGNTFQDAFAHWRQAQGLPALTIDVGFVVDIGWTASNPELLRAGKEGGEEEITSQDLMNLIEYHIMSWSNYRDGGASQTNVPPSAQVAIGVGANRSRTALLSHMKAIRASGSPAAGGVTTARKQISLKEKLNAAGNDVVTRSEIMEAALGDKMAQLLLLPRENVHLDDTFASHGVDSLVAVEIRSWVGKELDAKLVVSDILNGQTAIKDVVRHIALNKTVA